MWKAEEVEIIEGSDFDPRTPLATMEDVKRRLDAGYVVHQWQFKAFVEAYEKLRQYLERLEAAHGYLKAWAKANPQEIERYQAVKAAQRRKALDNLKAPAVNSREQAE